MKGRELRRLREQLGASEDDMAGKLGLTVVEYEAMEDSESVPVLYRMAAKCMLDHPDERPALPESDDIQWGADIERELVNDPIYDGRRWGPWRLNRESLTLDYGSRISLVDRDEYGAPIFKRREDYYITLTEVTSAKNAVDWLGQIAGKGWGASALGHLAEALDDIFGFQARFAHSNGFGNRDATLEHLQRVIKPRDDEEMEQVKAQNQWS